MDRLRTFLRHGETIVEITGRSVVVGRGADCEIRIDDELASREHCRIDARQDRVIVADLDSKNGVIVNGLALSIESELHHGDTVTIGREQIVLFRQHRTPRIAASSKSSRPRRSKQDSRDPTEVSNIYEILRGAAVTALDNGDVIGADSTAKNLFVTLRATIARQRPIPPGTLSECVDLALTLGERLEESRWLEQPLAILTQARAVMSDEQALRLAELVVRVGNPGRVLTDYVRMAREVGGAGDPSLARLANLR